MLKLLDRLGVPHVVLAPTAPHQLAAAIELRLLLSRDGREPGLMAEERLTRDHIEADLRGQYGAVFDFEERVETPAEDDPAR